MCLYYAKGNDVGTAAPADEPLVKRLRLSLNETPDLIPPLLLRKYIGYARKYCTPK